MRDTPAEVGFLGSKQIACAPPPPPPPRVLPMSAVRGHTTKAALRSSADALMATVAEACLDCIQQELFQRSQARPVVRPHDYDDGSSRAVDCSL